MSMKCLEPNLDEKMDGEDNDDEWIEQEIQRELNTLPQEIDDIEEENNFEEIDDSSFQDMPSMLEYVDYMKNQTKWMEAELAECDTLLEESNLITSKKNTHEILLELAKEEGVDPEDLKNQVLAKLDKEDEEENKFLQDSTRDLNGNEECEDEGDNLFITAAADIINKECLDQEVAIDLPESSTTEKYPAMTEKLSLKPGEGVMVEISESEKLERSLERKVQDWMRDQDNLEVKREREALSRKEESDGRIRAWEIRKEEKHKEFEQQQTILEEQRIRKEKLLEEETRNVQERIAKSLQEFEISIQELERQTEKEQSEWKKAADEQIDFSQKKRLQSAIKIQAVFRAYRVRKVYSVQIKNKLMAWKSQKEEKQIKDIETRRANEKRQKDEEQRKKEEDLKRKEEEKKKAAVALERKKEMEEKKKEIEERKKEEEMQQKLEEEKKTAALEMRRKKELEDRLKELEVKKKEEIRKKEEKKKAVALAKKKEMEEQILALEKKKLEEEMEMKEKKRKEEEKRAQAEKQKCLNEEKNKAKQEEIEKLSNEKSFEETAKQITDNREKCSEGRSHVLLSESKNIAIKIEKPENKNQRQVIDEKVHDSKLNNGEVKSSGINSNKEPSVTSQILTDGKRSKTVTVESVEKGAVEWGDSLPADIEQKRLAWIKQCTPWSKTIGELKTRKNKPSTQNLRRLVSKLPPMEESLILSAAKVNSLKQVTTVELCDLPGCSINTLGKCSQLKALYLNRCNLTALEGIENCKELQYLDVQNNAIVSMNLKDLENLIYLVASHNSLNAINGLDGCHNLRHLDLCHNRITRIAGLGSLKKLHTLLLSHNQLITTHHLGDAATIQKLDLSHNHLSAVDEVDKLALLQELILTGNNLMQVPSLGNQVLLSHLCLNENSITSVSSLSQQWLPHLQSLHVSQNSLTVLKDLRHCILLNLLDISNNQILDKNNLLNGLVSLHILKELSLEGNPVGKDPELKDYIFKAVPTIKHSDKTELETSLEIKPTPFEAMCLHQLNQHSSLYTAYQDALSKCLSKVQSCHLHQQYFDHSHKLAEEHRLSHEYGCSIANDEAPSLPQFTFSYVPSPPPKEKESSTTSHIQTVNMKAKFEAALQGSKKTHIPGADPAGQSGNVTDNVETYEKTGYMIREIVKESAADTSANGSRDESQSKAELVNLQEKTSASRIQPSKIPATKVTGDMVHGRQETEHFVQNYNNIEKHVLQTAAIAIQASWRGYILRKRLAYAMNFLRMEEVDADYEEKEFEEIDLMEFDCGMDDIDKDWQLPDTPQIPADHPVLNHPSAMLSGNDVQMMAHPPTHPKSAWRNADSPLIDNQNFPSGKPPLPPLSRLSDGPESRRTDLSHRSGMSRKEEKLSEEWGFKDDRTAALMLQRAKKLKYNALKKRKINQLDPKQRLALYRKLEEATHLKPPVSPSKKIIPARKEYFKALDQKENQKKREEFEEKTEKVNRTYKWIHTQVGDHDLSSPVPETELKRRGPYTGDNNLPVIDPVVLQAGRALLTGSPQTLELESVESGSYYGGSHAYSNRRRSLCGSTGTKSPADKLPPIKTSSAPSTVSVKDDRISFRNPVLQKSVGWGGGKKRTK